MGINTTPADDCLSVSSLVALVRRQVEAIGQDLWIQCEISQFTERRHWYFTVKDAGARIGCIAWSSVVRSIGIIPEVGMMVRLRGYPTVYVKEGRLQFIVRQMVPLGEGALHRAFEALKARLQKEGLFEPARKRNLPSYPATIGVVTSGESAAFRDIAKVVGERFPSTRIILQSVRVQGAYAPSEIAKAIGTFSSLPAQHPQRPDVLIVGRGGGAIEDLWAFNEEEVARAIFACSIPVISAVGHETDHTIADLVADCRAATPSNAAEIAVPMASELSRRVIITIQAWRNSIASKVQMHRSSVLRTVESRRINRPIRRLNDTRQDVDRYTDRLMYGMRRRTADTRARIMAVQGRLETLDPERALQLGYIRVERNGQRVRMAGHLQAGDRVLLQFIDGPSQAKILPAEQ